MEVALGLLLAGFVFGAMFLMMLFGYQKIEQERAASEDAHVAEQVRDRPRFFANLTPGASVSPVPVVPAHVIERLEQRLRFDYQDASRFASQPTMEGICPDYSAYVDAVASELERHIQRENAATMAFVAEPTVERLCSDAGPPISAALRRHHANHETAATAHARRIAS